MTEYLSDSNGIFGVGGGCVGGCCIGDEVADMDVDGGGVSHAVARGDEGNRIVACVGVDMGESIDVGSGGQHSAVAKVPEEAVGVR